MAASAPARPPVGPRRGRRPCSTCTPSAFRAESSTLGGAEHWQHGTAGGPRSSSSLERRFRARLGGDDAGAREPTTSPTPSRAIAHEGIMVPAVYDWLAGAADRLPHLVEFLALEGGPDAGFDDLVALCQIGLSGLPKLTLAANYWDEMGRGALAPGAHRAAPRHGRRALGVRTIPARNACRSKSSNRQVRSTATSPPIASLQPEMLGSLGLLEVQAGPRCRARRLRAAPPRRPWPPRCPSTRSTQPPTRGTARTGSTRRRYAPVVVDHPDWAPRILRGARSRALVNRTVLRRDAQRASGWSSARHVNERPNERALVRLRTVPRAGYDDTVLAPRPVDARPERSTPPRCSTVVPQGPLLELHCGAGHIGQAAALSVRAARSCRSTTTPSACASGSAGTPPPTRSTPTCGASPLEELGSRDESFALCPRRPAVRPVGERPPASTEDPTHAIDGGRDGLDGIRASLPVAVRD